MSCPICDKEDERPQKVYKTDRGTIREWECPVCHISYHTKEEYYMVENPSELPEPLGD